MADFLAMGGYAAFVWPAWGTGIAVLVAITIHTIACRRRASQKLALIELARANSGNRNKNNG